MKRIEQMYAFVAEDAADDTEGVCAHMMGNRWMPMVSADVKRLPQLREIAQGIADAAGMKIRLVRFEVRTELEEFDPHG